MRNFAKAAAIRALRTIAQTAVSMLPVAARFSSVDWHEVVGTALLAGFVSILTSIATGLPEVQQGAK